MSIEVRAAELHRLAATLRANTDEADELALRLARPPSVGSPLQASVDALLDAHRAAAQALAGELSWLAATISGVADSWLRLDGSLLGPRGQATPR